MENEDVYYNLLTDVEMFTRGGGLEEYEDNFFNLMYKYYNRHQESYDMFQEPILARLVADIRKTRTKRHAAFRRKLLGQLVFLMKQK